MATPNPTGAVEVLDTINLDRQVSYRRGTAEDFYAEVEKRTQRAAEGSSKPRYVVQYLVYDEVVADNQGRGGKVRVFDEELLTSGRAYNPERRSNPAALARKLQV